MNTLFVIITTIFLSFSALSRVVPEEFKNIHDVFTKQSEHLSPLPGFIWAIGGVVENLDELGGFEKNPNILLLKKLFHRVDPSTYRETRSESNPASHLTLLSIGKIAAILDTLKTTLSEEKIRLLATQRPEVLAKNAELKNYIDSLKEVITGDLKGNLAQKREFAKPIQQLALLLVRALLSSKDDISVFKVLGAFVYFKANDKEHLHDYYKGLSDNGTRDHLFNDPEFLTKKQHEWVADRYGEHDLNTTLDQITSYEQKAFFVLKNVAKSWVESYLTAFNTAYLSTGFGFPDCGENSLLNLYRMIFAKKDLTIDLELLEKVNSPQKIKAFFSRFNTLSTLRSDDARNAWADLTSNIPTLCSASAYYDRESYCGIKRKADENCEMNPGFSTMNAFIKEIQGQTFEELIDEVNKHTDDNFSFTKKLDDENKLGDIKINTKDRGDFELVFQPGHFIFRATTKSEIVDNTLDTLLREQYPVKDLIALVPISSKKMERLEETYSISFEYKQSLLTPNNDDEIVFFFGEMILKNTPPNYFNILDRVQNLDSKLRIRESVLLSRKKTKIAYLNWLVKAKQENILEVENNGRTALHEAARSKESDTEVFGLIFKHMNQPAIDKRDNNGQTALHRAVDFKQPEDVIDMLLFKMGQDAIEAVDKDGATALDIAYEKDLYTIGKKLLEKMRPESIKSDLLGTAVVHGNYKFAELLVSKMTTEAIDSVTVQGKPILQFAVQWRPLKIVKFLTQNMSKEAIEAKDASGQSTLDIALDIAKKHKDYEKSDHLIEVIGAEHLKNRFLRKALEENETKFGEYLLKKMTPAEIEAKDSNGTVLHLAAQLGNVDIIKVLTAKMTQEAIEAKNESGKTALHFAASNGNQEVVGMLAQRMSCKALQTQDEFGDTALRVAQANKHQNVVELLEATAKDKAIANPAECFVP